MHVKTVRKFINKLKKVVAVPEDAAQYSASAKLVLLQNYGRHSGHQTTSTIIPRRFRQNQLVSWAPTTTTSPQTMPTLNTTTSATASTTTTSASVWAGNPCHARCANAPRMAPTYTTTATTLSAQQPIPHMQQHTQTWQAQIPTHTGIQHHRYTWQAPNSATPYHVNSWQSQPHALMPHHGYVQFNIGRMPGNMSQIPGNMGQMGQMHSHMVATPYGTQYIQQPRIAGMQVQQMPGMQLQAQQHLPSQKIKPTVQAQIIIPAWKIQFEKLKKELETNNMQRYFMTKLAANVKSNASNNANIYSDITNYQLLFQLKFTNNHLKRIQRNPNGISTISWLTTPFGKEGPPKIVELSKLFPDPDELLKWILIPSSRYILKYYSQMIPNNDSGKKEIALFYGLIKLFNTPPTFLSTSDNKYIMDTLCSYRVQVNSRDYAPSIMAFIHLETSAPSFPNEIKELIVDFLTTYVKTSIPPKTVANTIRLMITVHGKPQGKHYTTKGNNKRKANGPAANKSKATKNAKLTHKATGHTNSQSTDLIAEAYSNVTTGECPPNITPYLNYLNTLKNEPSARSIAIGLIGFLEIREPARIAVILKELCQKVENKSKLHHLINLGFQLKHLKMIANQVEYIEILYNCLYLKTLKDLVNLNISLDTYTEFITSTKGVGLSKGFKDSVDGTASFVKAYEVFGDQLISMINESRYYRAKFWKLFQHIQHAEKNARYKKVKNPASYYMVIDLCRDLKKQCTDEDWQAVSRQWFLRTIKGNKQSNNYLVNKLYEALLDRNSQLKNPLESQVLQWVGK